MEGTDTKEGKLGEIELKLLKTIILKDVEKILRQVSHGGKDFLYPILDFGNSSDRLIAMNPLVKGEFMGYRYEICTNGSHPTAYVHCGMDSYADEENCRDLPVHGGCTFSGTRPRADGIWVRWDYGHYGDFMMDVGRAYTPFIGVTLQNGKKWTVAEVMLDVIRAIMYIEEHK